MFKKIKRLLFLVFIAVIITLPISYFLIDRNISQPATNSLSYLEQLEKKALSGDANAMFRMGNNHYYGYNGLEVNYNEAVRWYKLAIEHGDGDAMNNLALMYEKGEGVELDFKKTFELFEKSANLGNLNGMVNFGRTYTTGKHVKPDFEEAEKWFRKAADLGNSSAQYNIGIIYYRGLGHPRDYGEATKWFRKAAEQGYINAQFQLGDIYHDSKGLISTDYKEAEKWYRKAADQGHVISQYNLAGMYFKGGEQFEVDYIKSGYWYDLASKNGDKSAKNFLDECNKYCSTKKINEKTVQYCLVAASAGYVSSQEMVGSMYNHGKILKQDYQEAFKWYLNAAKQGSVKTQSAIAVLYSKGLGVEKDDIEQYVWAYIATHSTPRSEFELKIQKMAEILLINLEPRINDDEILMAKERAQEFLVKYGNQSR